MHVHNNGIFDVKWSPSDNYIATASGDRTIAITDPNTSTSSALYHLIGHSHTTKCVTWDPKNNSLLASGGRDGSILLWDLRTRSGGNDGDRAPVVTILYAHEDIPGKATRRGRLSLTPKSITSLVYPQDSDHEIISSGAATGFVSRSRSL